MADLRMKGGKDRDMRACTFLALRGLAIGALTVPTALIAEPTAHAAAAVCTVNGTATTSTFIGGTQGNDTIECLSGVPSGAVVNGRGGNDTITVEGPPDQDGNNGEIYGETGNDVIFVVGGRPSNVLRTAAPDGNDNYINGGPGDDRITVIGGHGLPNAGFVRSGGDGNNATIIGDGGNDTIRAIGGDGANGVHTSTGRTSDGAAGGYGNDGTIRASGTIVTIGGWGGDGASSDGDSDVGNGGDGNNRTIRTMDSEGVRNSVIMTGGGGGNGGGGDRRRRQRRQRERRLEHLHRPSRSHRRQRRTRRA